MNDTATFYSAVLNGNPTHLFWINQPLNATGGEAIPVVVGVRDQHDNFAITATGTMTLAIKPGTGTAGAVLGPPSEVSKSASGASAHAVSIDKEGTAYKLTATFGTLPPIDSDPFNIGVGTVAAIQILAGDGQGAMANDSLPDSLVVRAVDAGNNPINGAVISFAIDSGGAGAVAYSPTVTTGANGRAATTWRVGVVGQPQVLRASALSGSVFTKLHAFMAETLVVVTQPSSSPQNGVMIPQQPKVQLQDLHGHQVKRAGITIGAFPTPNASGPDADIYGTNKITDANGEATFTDLVLTGVAQSLKLQFARIVASIPQTAPIHIGESAALSLTAGVAAGVYQADTLFHVYSSAGSAQLQVRVKDTGALNVVQGASVTFSFDANIGCSLGSATATSDVAGIAQVTLTHSGGYGSCTVRARLTSPPPPPPCEGECIIISDHKTFDRTFVAPSGTKVWFGGWGYNFWGDGPNWSGGTAPNATTDVYIPLSAASQPYVYDFANGFRGNGTARSIYADHGTRIETNSDQDTLRVYGDFAVDTIYGSGLVWLSPDGTATGKLARGIVEGTLRVGTDTTAGDCANTTSAAYSLSDTLGGGALQLYCQVHLNGKVLHAGYSGLTTKRKGGLVMDNSTDRVIVLGDALFAGTRTTLTGGKATFMGNFEQFGDATVVTYNASSSHESLFAGEGQTQLIAMSDPNANRFGKITSGNVDFDVFFHAPSLQTFYASTLELLANSKFKVLDNITFNPAIIMGSGSVLTVWGNMGGVTSCQNNGGTVDYDTSNPPTPCLPPP